MANILQAAWEIYVVEGLTGSFKLVPECQTHPEDQMHVSD